MANKPHSGKFIKCICGKEFYIPKNRFDTAKYCSRECKNKFGCTQKIKSICGICAKEFEHISSRCNKAKYCSRFCYHRAQKGRGSKKFICRICKKEFMGSPSKRYSFCSPKCRGKFQRKPDEYNSFSCLRKAWKRRGWINKCEICGYSEVKDILGIHHKDKNRNNNSLENLMILCPNCHSLIHHKHICH